MVAARPDKAYRAECEAERALSAEALARLNLPSGLRVRQRTPARVRHRRADVERTRAIRSVKARPGDRPERFVLDLFAESGTYVKEFVSGDAGNTRPSVSEIAGVPCRCVLLDVMDVDWSPDCGCGGGEEAEKDSVANAAPRGSQPFPPGGGASR